MAIKGIISDWNGTLFKLTTDDVVCEGIAYGIRDKYIFKKRFFGKKIPKPWYWTPKGYKRCIQLKEAEKKIKKAREDFGNEKAHLWEVYKPFNKEVIAGEPEVFVLGFINEFAEAFGNDDNVDFNIIEIIEEMKPNVAITGILSISFDSVITAVLKNVGFLKVFDKIVSNNLILNGRLIKEITTEIYGKKREVFESSFFHEGSSLKPENTVYLGDTEDDAPIAGILNPGNFIVPFFATEKFKQKMASNFGAFVPKDKEDLRKYLASR